ncbi:MAG: thiamine pyrophosphate-dependent enzyme [Candidatus Alcyoniella australis]|nr:thiamine pyrophosphate-dependent enzyme [Candidatus Alcyoniella australis]
MSDYNVYAARLLPRSEFFTPGHRACQGCGPAIVLRQVAKALGRNTIVVNATGCMEIVVSPFPHSAWEIPWVHTLFENTAAVASGIEAGIKVLARRKRHFTDSGKINIIAIGGDGSTADIGMGCLSGALERGHDFIYLCYDNEAYMNTGIQRSSATPMGASTTTSPAGKASKGQFSRKKDLGYIAAAHHIPYVATVTPAHPFDLIDKLRKAAAVEGPAFIHAFAPCPTGWRCGADTTIKLARMAVDTGVFPLYEVVDGKWSLTHEIEDFEPLDEYLFAQGRFRHLKNDAEFVKQLECDVHQQYEEIRARTKAGA